MLRCVYDQTSDIVKSRQNCCNMRRKNCFEFCHRNWFWQCCYFSPSPSVFFTVHCRDSMIDRTPLTPWIDKFKSSMIQQSYERSGIKRRWTYFKKMMCDWRRRDYATRLLMQRVNGSHDCSRLMQIYAEGNWRGIARGLKHARWITKDESRKKVPDSPDACSRTQVKVVAISSTGHVTHVVRLLGNFRGLDVSFICRIDAWSRIAERQTKYSLAVQSRRD